MYIELLVVGIAVSIWKKKQTCSPVEIWIWIFSFNSSN